MREATSRTNKCSNSSMDKVGEEWKMDGNGPPGQRGVNFTSRISGAASRPALLLGSAELPVGSYWYTYYKSIVQLKRESTTLYNADRTKVQRPGIEPGTYAVLKRRHNQLDHHCARFTD